MYIVLTLETQVDSAGNRRILFVVLDPAGNPVKAFVKGYGNPSLVTSWFYSQDPLVVSKGMSWGPQINVFVREWNAWRKSYACS